MEDYAIILWCIPHNGLNMAIRLSQSPGYLGSWPILAYPYLYLNHKTVANFLNLQVMALDFLIRYWSLSEVEDCLSGSHNLSCLYYIVLMLMCAAVFQYKQITWNVKWYSEADKNCARLLKVSAKLPSWHKHFDLFFFFLCNK